MSRYDYYRGWAPYVPVAERRAKAKRETQKMSKKGKKIQPVEITASKIAHSFWGKGWCQHLESFSDFENRLPRGRTYVRNGSVCHLEIKPGVIEALVSGSHLYKITIKIKPLKPATWKAVKNKCRGQIGSLLELLQGKLSDHVMKIVSHREEGLFPQPGEIELGCSCPDWADMCKHVAAALYGVGSRLDSCPELLFVLRGVEASELIAAEVALPADADAASADTLSEAGLSAIFGIELDNAPVQQAAPAKAVKAKGKTKSKPKPIAALVVEQAEPVIEPVAIVVAPAATPRTRAKRIKGAAAVPVISARTVSGRQATVFDYSHPTGEAIAQWRKQTGLTVTAFARALGVSAPSIDRWEACSGPLRLHARPLAALARVSKEFGEGDEDKLP